MTTVATGAIAAPLHGAARADIVEWDVENWSAALAYWRKHSVLTLAGCAALEIGSRHGGLALWLALAEARVVCSDLGGPSADAERKHQRYGVAERITYADVDALDIPYENAFDLVVMKSVLGGIGRDGRVDRQRAAIAQIYKALRPGGELWLAENLTGSPLHRLLRTRFVRWGRSWRYLCLPEVRSFLRPFDRFSCASYGVLGTFGRTEAQRIVLGRLDRLAFNGLVPDSWRYIAMAVARK